MSVSAANGTSRHPSLLPMPPRFVLPRLVRTFAVFVALSVLLAWFFLDALRAVAHDFLATPDVRALGHPSFADVREYERQLPQHSLPWPWAARPKFLLISGEAWGSGWNNVLQEQLLNTDLAYISNRAYVFRDFSPSAHPPFPDTLPDGTRHLLNVPMNALISGPTGGGPHFVDPADAGDLSPPRAISRQWWDRVCPDTRVVHLNVYATNSELDIVEETDSAEIMKRWGAKLRDINAECVSIDGGSIFGWMLLGGERVLPVWKTYGSSPALKAFAWSPIVARALERNFHLVSSLPPPPHLSRIRPAGRLTSGDASSPYPFKAFAPYHTATPPIAGLLGLHVRRGDYEGHCHFLAGVGAGYTGWTAFGAPHLRNMSYPALPDYLDVPEGMSRLDAAYAHCWPTPAKIVERARAVRTASESGKMFPAQKLRTVYIATNGEREWVSDLAALLKADGWEQVSSSLDMKLSQDEYAVSQAVDMSVLVAAETFIGVGFSSFTSNVVQLRLSGNRYPGTCRFWSANIELDV
ncbi:hypothetical protein C8J57DRAFT_1355873 [Mycena rebaudengoi]|nr:hypothetical protein C8J57DRAFT_1355873 [Mycena rebaudengoi]